MVTAACRGNASAAPRTQAVRAGNRRSARGRTLQSKCKNRRVRARPRPYVSSDQSLILDATANHIDRVLDHYADFGFSTDWRPAADSPLRYDEMRLLRQYGPGSLVKKTEWTGGQLRTRMVAQSRYWDSSAAGYASESCLLLTSLAGQYLEALRILLRDREVLFAPTPLARSVLEIAGYVYWLLDPDVVSIRDRAARALLAQVSDATRRKTVALHFKHPDAPKIGGLVHRLRKKDLPALFYPSELVDPNAVGSARAHKRSSGQLHIRQQAQPGLQESLQFITRATGNNWNTSGMYAYLSNASHPTPHVVYEAIHRDSSGRVLGFAYDNANLPYRVSRLAVLSFLLTWRIGAAYRGLDQDLPLRLSLEMDDLPSL